MLGTPEGARRRSLDALIDSMLAEDAYRHDYEAAPPIDPETAVFGAESGDILWSNPSVMDTAFLSPEEHKALSKQAQEESRWRELEAENQSLIRDYPEDWVAGGVGLVQLGKGLTKATLAHIARQQARKRRLEYTRNVLRPQAQYKRRARHNDMSSGWGNENFKNIHARRTDPHSLRKANRKYIDEEGTLAEDVYGDPVNDPEAFAEIDAEFDMYATKEEMDLLEGTDALGKVMGRDRPVHDWIEDIEWPRISASNPPPPRPHGPPRPPSLGVKGGHEGYSELPKYMKKWEVMDWFRRGGPRPSANSIIPAAVLMESMTE